MKCNRCQALLAPGDVCCQFCTRFSDAAVPTDALPVERPNPLPRIFALVGGLCGLAVGMFVLPVKSRTGIDINHAIITGVLTGLGSGLGGLIGTFLAWISSTNKEPSRPE